MKQLHYITISILGEITVGLLIRLYYILFHILSKIKLTLVLLLIWSGIYFDYFSVLPVSVETFIPTIWWEANVVFQYRYCHLRLLVTVILSVATGRCIATYILLGTGYTTHIACWISSFQEICYLKYLKGIVNHWSIGIATTTVLHPLNFRSLLKLHLGNISSVWALLRWIKNELWMYHGLLKVVLMYLIF